MDCKLKSCGSIMPLALVLQFLQTAFVAQTAIPLARLVLPPGSGTVALNMDIVGAQMRTVGRGRKSLGLTTRVFF
jgi:hypothetical protein